jgi:hypothetical protein
MVLAALAILAIATVVMVLPAAGHDIKPSGTLVLGQRQQPRPRDGRRSAEGDLARRPLPGR